MTAPQRAFDANSRGIAVLVAAVVIGFLLLFQAGISGGGDGDDTAAPVTTTTLPGASTTTDPDSGLGTTGTTTTSTEPRSTSDVMVAVINGNGTGGLATTTMQTVTSAGYAQGSTGNLPGGTDTTAVYYREGYQAEATALATLLNQPGSAVQALGDPINDTADTDMVVVVLGRDYQPQG